MLDTDFTIKVLDDGTPEKYLKHLSAKYPEIEIYKSDFYEDKVAKITNESSYSGNAAKADIPIKLWMDTAQKATDYFLLLEDDIWFTEKIHLKDTESFLRRENVFFLKLFWLGNDKLIEKKRTKENEVGNAFINVFKPQVYTLHPFLFRVIFKMNRFKIRKVLTYLGIYTYERFLKYYTIYSVAGVVFKKEYFLSLWSNHKNRVDERLQLFNAVKYYHQNRTINFANTTKEVLKTGFLSSATNQNKKDDGANFDVFTFNKILNEAWFEGDFNVMENFPGDLNQEKIARLLEKENHPRAQKKEWQHWVSNFKNQFISFGCKID